MQMESLGLKEKILQSILGRVEYRRSMFQCPSCGKTRFPGDEILDVENTSRTPGLRRMMARAGSKTPFKEAAEDLLIYAGVSISPKDLERVAERIGEQTDAWVCREGEKALADEPSGADSPPAPILYVLYDGTGVPMMKSELAGRKGKQPDGSAKTREAKLGCVFTQTTTDEEGRPIRDPESTSFVGAIENAENFGWRIFKEAKRRGLDRAERVAVLADGAKWAWNLANLHFPRAVQIVDIYHAKEHVADLCKLLFKDEKERSGFRLKWWTDMEDGRIENIVAEAKLRLPRHDAERKAAKKQIAYLLNNRERMRYAAFRLQGFFVGSGVIEAGCRTIIGLRLKQSGMEWSVAGANKIIALRCVIQSGLFEDYWISRSA